MRAGVIAALLLLGAASVAYAAAAQRPKPEESSVSPPRETARDLAPLRYDSAQLHAYSTTTLIAFFTRPSQELNADQSGAFLLPLKGLPMQRHLVEVQAELVGRRPVEDLLAAFEQPADHEQQAWMTWILQQIPDRRIERRMRWLARSGDDDRAYFAAKFLAERGDVAALARLNSGRFALRAGPAWLEWAEEIELFGRYRYAPATFHLVDAFEAPSLDVVVAALQSLKQIYPQARGRYDDIEDAERYWRHFASRFSWPPDCRVSELLTNGIGMPVRRATEVTPRNDAWAALLRDGTEGARAVERGGAEVPPAKPEQATTLGEFAPAAPVPDRDDGAPAVASSAVEYFVDARGRYLLVEVCAASEGLHEGIHLLAIDEERRHFPWPEDGNLRRLVCETPCRSGDNCRYSIRSTDGQSFSLERIVEGDRPRLVEFTMAPGEPLELIEQCACDHPC